MGLFCLRYLAAILVGLFCTVQGVAQVDKYLDKVVLKNGSVVWGITEITDDEVLVHMNDEKAISFPLDAIASLKTGKLNPLYFQRKVEGPFYQVNFGVSLGKRHQEFPLEGNPNISVVAGYKFKPLLGVGLGMGWYYFPEFKHTPFFAEVQGDLTKTRVTPFYALRVGWSIASERDVLNNLVDKSKGGFYFEPGAGLKLHAGGHAWLLKVAYLRQRSETTYTPLDIGNGVRILNVEDRTYERTTITLGLVF